MAVIDAGTDDVGRSRTTRSPRDAAITPARTSFMSRLMSRATALYCPVCGEELGVTPSSVPSEAGRYCVEDHTRR